MAKRQPVEAKVQFSTRDLPGFLDMLRYDQPTVIDWSNVDTDRAGVLSYTATLRSNPERTPGYEFTPDRWASFGLYLKDMEGNPVR